MGKFRTADPILKLRLLHLGSIFFEEPVVWISLNCVDGQLQIYPGHAPLLTSLKPGYLRIMPLHKSKIEKLFLGESIVQVNGAQATIFSTHLRTATPNTNRKSTPYMAHEKSSDR